MGSIQQGHAWFEDSGVFREVLDGSSIDSTDLHVFMRIIHEYKGHSPPMWILSAFTAGIIPVVDHRWTVTVELDVRDNTGKRLGIVSATETETTRFPTLFLFVAPLSDKLTNR